MSENADFAWISRWIPEGSRVLDLGCGDGSLMEYLVARRQINAQGVEIDPEQISACVRKGLNVFLSDLDTGLSDYPDGMFETVILHNAIQELRRPDTVIREAFRVGSQVIISFPNFGFYRHRWQFLLTGKTPISESLPFPWYESPNLHFLTIRDFREYIETSGYRISQKIALHKGKSVPFFANLLATQAIFLIENTHERHN